MFESDVDSDKKNDRSTDVRRRAFLTSAAAVLGGLVLWQWKRPRVLEANTASDNEPKQVTVVLFSDSGERLKKVRHRESGQNAGRMAQATFPERLRHHAQC